MWKLLLILLKDTQDINKVTTLQKECEAQGIIVKTYTNQIYYYNHSHMDIQLLRKEIFQQFFIPEEVLLLTDDNIVAKNAILNKIAVLGYEKKEIFFGVRYITQSLEDLYFDYLNMVYCRFHKLPILIQETKHLYIREMTQQDAKDFFELQQEKDIASVMEKRRTSIEEEREFIKAYCENQYAFYGYGFWAIVEKSTGNIIGKIGIEEHNREGKDYLELGYWIRQSERKKGYAYEAGKAVLAYCREELELSGEIYCFVQPENISSLKTAQKLGFLKTEQITDKCYVCVHML